MKHINVKRSGDTTGNVNTSWWTDAYLTPGGYFHSEFSARKKRKKVFPQLELNLCPRHMIPLPLPLRDGTCLLVDERWWQTYGEQTAWPEPVQQSRLCTLTVQSGTVSGSATPNPPVSSSDPFPPAHSASVDVKEGGRDRDEQRSRERGHISILKCKVTPVLRRLHCGVLFLLPASPFWMISISSTVKPFLVFIKKIP